MVPVVVVEIVNVLVAVLVIPALNAPVELLEVRRLAGSLGVPPGVGVGLGMHVGCVTGPASSG